MGMLRTLSIVLALTVSVGWVAAPVHAQDAGDTPEPPPTAAEEPRPDEESDEPPPGDEDDIPPALVDTGPKPTFVPVVRYDVKRKLVFPVVGASKFWSGFGACRDECTREHHGVDIVTAGWKGLPIVAAHDGTVVGVTYDEGNPGCSVRIRGRDRWETRYYHLNNDLPGTDEVGAPCPAAGIEVGATVRAGQIIGYMGDSGNAETTPPHLHFELRNRSGYPIDPYRSLKAAERISYAWLPVDAQASSIVLSQATHADGARVIIVVPGDEIDRLGASESSATILEAPLIVVDRNDPLPALQEIGRLAPDRIVGMSDANAAWLSEVLRPLAPIVAIDPIPDPGAVTPPVEPADAMTPTVITPVDRFTTLVVGVVDKIRKSRVSAYDDFIVSHRSLVLTTDRWAPTRIGSPSASRPDWNADPQMLWWPTGSGWVSTATVEEAPAPGMAYVTARRLTPSTLTFLGSLAESSPSPIWRSFDR